MLTVPPPARIPWLGETEVSVGAGQAARATPQLVACVQLKLASQYAQRPARVPELAALKQDVQLASHAKPE